MTDKADWLAGLKVGDLVVVMSSGVGNKHGHLTKVARVTPTQIVTQPGGRYQRKSGDGVGKSGYYFSWLDEPTSEREFAIKAEQAVREVQAINWRDVPISTVEAVLALVPKASKGGG